MKPVHHAVLHRAERGYAGPVHLPPNDFHPSVTRDGAGIRLLLVGEQDGVMRCDALLTRGDGRYAGPVTHWGYPWQAVVTQHESGLLLAMIPASNAEYEAYLHRWLCAAGATNQAGRDGHV